MVFTAFALLAPLVYTTAVNALPLESKASRHVRRQSGGANWNALACYTDNVAARTLKGAQLVSNTMTTATCQAFCYSKGYKYAGTEWSTECYCDNDFQNGGVVADDGCNMPCSGAAGQTCGGPVRLTVYQNTGELSPPQTSGPPTSSIADWTTSGCFTDVVANRALPNQVYVDGGMTPEKCTSKCYGLGFTFAGVEYAGECFCGTTIGSSGQPATDGCTMPCSGSSAEICGGANRLNIYTYSGANTPTPPSTPAPVNGATPLADTGFWDLIGQTGCYTDSVANRALGLRVFVDGAMTVPKCTSKCFSLGYSYSGVEFADECYCGGDIGSSGAPADNGCNMPCSGDASTICGGADRLTVYRFAAKGGPSASVLASYNGFDSQGCYTDSVQARVMTPMAVAGQMTVEGCIDACNAAGFPVAGVEYAAECYCSAVLPADSFKASDHCDMPCAGNLREICGGADRLNVYKIQPAVTETPTLTQASYSHWGYVGCMTLSDPIPTWATGDRIDRPHTQVDPNNQGRTCMQYCETFQYRTAMVAGTTCRCSPGPPPFSSISQGTCNAVCPGNSLEICGNGNLQDGYGPVSLYTYIYE